MSDSDVSTDEDEVDLDRAFHMAESPPPKELVPLLECPVCFELPFPPIRTCYQGHIICRDCSKKLKVCPLCQKPIGYGRNFFAEDLINKSKMSCKYQKDGCELLLNGELMEGHLMQCQYRPINCNFCKTRIPLANVENHLKNQHQITKWDLNDEGDKIIEFEQRRRVVGVKYNINDLAYSTFVIKSLFAALAISFLADQICDLYLA